MRRFLYVLGAIFLVLIVAVVGGFGYLIVVGGKLDRESKAYVDEAVPAIVADWSVDELRKRASPDLLKSVKPDDLRTTFVLFGKLGPLVQYEGSKGDSNVSVMAGSGETITARYVARAMFKNGEATIQIVVLKLNGTWKIQSFHVNSTAMLEQAVGRWI